MFTFVTIYSVWFARNKSIDGVFMYHKVDPSSWKGLTSQSRKKKNDQSVMRNCRSGGEYYYIFLVTHKSRQKPSHHFKFTLKPGYLQDICGTVTGFCEFCRTRFSLVVRKQQKTPWTLPLFKMCFRFQCQNILPFFLPLHFALKCSSK